MVKIRMTLFKLFSDCESLSTINKANKQTNEKWFLKKKMKELPAQVPLKLVTGAVSPKRSKHVHRVLVCRAEPRTGGARGSSGAVCKTSGKA